MIEPDNVHYLREQVARVEEALQLEGGGGPPYDGTMEARLSKLETRLETVLPTLATKADVAEAKSDIIKWLSGIMIALTALIISVMAFMLGKIPAAMPTAAPQPIVIQVPAAASTPAPSAK